MVSFLSGLLRLSLFGSLLALLMVVLRLLFKGRVSQAVYYYLWLLVLFRLCIPIGITVSLPAAASDVFHTDTVSEPALAKDTADLPVQGENKRIEPDAEGLERIYTEGNTVSHSYRQKYIWNDAVFWVVLWGLGAAICVGWYLTGYLKFIHVIRRTAWEIPMETLQAWGMLDFWNSQNKSGRMRLAVCPKLRTPMLVGLLKPVIVIPDGPEGRPDGHLLWDKQGFQDKQLPQDKPLWDKRVLQDILCHELMHARHHDLLYKWAAVIVAALHWFNPVMILVRREIGRACELFCDEAVICGMDTAGRRHYGETLLSLASLPSGIGMLTAPLCKEKKHLKERLVGIVEYRKKGGLAVLLSMLLGLAAGGCALISDADISRPGQNQTAVSVSDSGDAVSDTGNGMDLYRDVLSGVEPFQYVPGKGVGDQLIKTVGISSVPGIFSPDSSYASIWRFTVLDLDGDGKEEVVLQVTDVGGDMGGYMILHQQAGIVYGYAGNYRIFENLKSDGTYMYTNLTVTERGIGKILRFSEEGYTAKPIMYEAADDGWQSVTYYNGQKMVAAEDYEREERRQGAKPDAVWHDFTDDGIKEAFSSLHSADSAVGHTVQEVTQNTGTAMYSFPVKVSEGKELTVVLQTKDPADKDYFAVDRIQIYHGKEQIQTIQTASLPAVEEYAWDGLFVNKGSKVGEPDVRDVNFDGAQDFGLLAVETYPHNVPYSYFLWNADAGRFDYGFTLFGSKALEVDEKRRYLVEESHDVNGVYQTVYQYTADGKLLRNEDVQRDW